MSSRIEPHKAMNVIYRAIGGSELAAIVTEVRADGCSLTVFPPHTLPLFLSRIPFVAYHLDSDAHSICYPPPGKNEKVTRK